MSDELKERVDELETINSELNEKIEELEQSLEEESDRADNMIDDGYDRAMLEMEGNIEHAFSAGFKVCMAPVNQGELKELLNYKIEQRL